MPFDFSKRRLLLSAGGMMAASMLPGIALADAKSDAIMRAMPQLYRTIGSIGGEHRRVRYFFAPTCEFSRQLHEPIFNWGVTVPKELEFLPTPVIPKQDDSGPPNAMAFYAAWFASPKKLGEYMRVLYRLIQGSGQDPTNIKTYALAAKEAGVDMQGFYRGLGSDAVLIACQKAAEIGSRYQLQRTPTVGICGRYVITPDGVAGNKDLLLQLMNALTSKAIIDNTG